jgi:hypothetical protein
VAAAERVHFSRAFHERRLAPRDKYFSSRAHEREVAARLAAGSALRPNRRGDWSMTNFEKPLDFPDRGVSGIRGLPSVASIKAAVLLALLIAYGLGFAVLYPLVQTSVTKSTAEGNEPFFVGS